MTDWLTGLGSSGRWDWLSVSEVGLSPVSRSRSLSPVGVRVRWPCRCAGRWIVAGLVPSQRGCDLMMMMYMSSVHVRTPVCHTLSRSPTGRQFAGTSPSSLDQPAAERQAATRQNQLPAIAINQPAIIDQSVNLSQSSSQAAQPIAPHGSSPAGCSDYFTPSLHCPS